MIMGDVRWIKARFSTLNLTQKPSVRVSLIALYLKSRFYRSVTSQTPFTWPAIAYGDLVRRPVPALVLSHVVDLQKDHEDCSDGAGEIERGRETYWLVG